MNIRGSIMSTSASKNTIDEFGDDCDADETLPLPSLGHFPTVGESPKSGIDYANADLIDKRLEQLVGLSESMLRSLETIADLLVKQAPRSRPRTTKKKKSASRKSPKA
jgi:hypothetical protein